MSVPDPTLRFRRQLDLLPLDKLDVPITVIGAGAVGSFTVVAIAKMGLRQIHVFDDDHVELGNLPSQFFTTADVGRPKVHALADMVRALAGTEIRGVERRFGGEPLRGIVVSAVDSMASREAIWRAVRYDPSVTLYLDARMAALVSIVHVVRPCDVGDVRRYEASLHSDAEAYAAPCSGRSIIFTVLALAATLARLVRMELVGQELPREITQDHQLGLLLTS